MSVAMQTVKPDKFIIYDDGEHKDLRSETIYQNIFAVLDEYKIKWSVYLSNGKGQVVNHQHALDHCDTEWLWRMDDDHYAEPTALEEMLKHTKDDKVGAVGSLVLHNNYRFIQPSLINQQKDKFAFSNAQWVRWKSKEPIEIDHLYGTFIYRKEAGKHGYNKNLSIIGHHEESLFTLEMYKAGWKVLIEPSAVIWHIRDNQGGIRSHTVAEAQNYDTQIFGDRLKALGLEWVDTLPDESKTMGEG